MKRMSKELKKLPESRLSMTESLGIKPTAAPKTSVFPAFDLSQKTAPAPAISGGGSLAAILKGPRTGIAIDASYGRTAPTGTVETGNLPSLKKQASSARWQDFLLGFAPVADDTISQDADYVQTKKAAEKRSGSAQAAYSEAIRGIDQEKRVQRLAELEAVRDEKQQPKLTGTVWDLLNPPPAEDFKTVARRGRKENPREFQTAEEQGKPLIKTNKMGYRSDIEYMTEDEKDVYAYYLVKDKNKAIDYFDTLSTAINYRKQQDISDFTKDAAEKAPVLGVLNNVYSGFFSPAGLVGTAGKAAANMVTGEENPLDPNSQWFAATHSVRDSAEGLKRNVESPLGQFLVDTGLSMAQFATKIPLGPLALPMMASGAGGQTAMEVTERGGTVNEALGMGLVAAAAEYVTEKMSFDSLMKIFKSGGKGYQNAFRSALSNIGKQAGTEAFEELTSEYLNNIGDALIMGDRSEMQIMVQELVTQGMSEEEAVRRAAAQFWIINPMLAGAGGALSGGFMGASGSFAGNLSQAKADKQTGAELRSQWGTEAGPAAREVVETGREYSEQTGARYYAEAAADRLDSGRRLSDLQLGRVYRETVNAQAREAEAYFKQSFKNAPYTRVDAEGRTILPTHTDLADWALRQEQNKHAERLASSLRQFGVRGVVVEHMPENVTGRWEKGVVYVSSALDTAAAVNAKVAHEISHAAQEGDTAFTADILNAVQATGRDVVSEIDNKKSTYAEFFRERGRGAKWIEQTVTDGYAADEIAADYIGELLRNDGAIAALNRQPGLAQRMLDAVNRLLGRKVSGQERAVYAELAGRLRAVAGAEKEDGSSFWTGTSLSVSTPGEKTSSDFNVLQGEEGVKGDLSGNARYSVEAESFTNEEIARGVEAVARMGPVTELRTDLFKKGEIDLITQVEEYFDSIGNIARSPQLGPVILDRRGAKSDISHGIGRMKAISFAAVPAIIENGQIIDYQKNWDSKGYDTAVVAAPIMIGNEPYFAGVVLERSRGKNRFYLHEVLTEKEGALSFKTGAGISDGLPGDKTPSILSLLHKVWEVKGNLSEDARYSVETDAWTPWEETEVQAQSGGYPVIDGKQVFPYKTWVRDKERGNFGLVVGMGTASDGSLIVSFWNKENGTRARVEKLDSELQSVTGQYQPSDAELAALFETEPAESLRGTVSAEEWAEYNTALNGERGEATSNRIDIETLPAKALNYLQREENRLTGRIAKLLDVPYQVRREQLRPIARQISEQYIGNGEISEAAAGQLFDEAWDAGIAINDEFYQEYRGLKSDLRDVAVTISAQDSADIADYNDWRRRQFGRLRILNEGGLPVDVRYQELSAVYPEMFPEAITHPADQLQQMSEVAGSIAKVEQSLNDYYGSQAEFMKEGARHEFDTLIMNHTPELSAVKNYYEQGQREAAEKERMLKLGGMTLDAQTVDMIKTLWTHEKEAKRAVENAASRNLLTEYDNLMVDKLLKGELSLDMLPEGVNYRGIRELFEARQPYEELMGQIRDFNRMRKAALRQEADSFLENVEQFNDKKAGILYDRETAERNIYDIVPDRQEADQIIQRYFKPVHTGTAEQNKMMNAYRKRVRGLDLSRKLVKGNKLTEAAAVQLLGEAQDSISYLTQPNVVKRGENSRDGHTLEEWRGIQDDVLANNPNMDMDKIQSAIEAFRDIYDELFEKMNEVRIRNGYEPTPYRRGYFPHFQRDMGDTLLARFGRALGFEIRTDNLPTTINGITHTFRPGIRWMGNTQQRAGYQTTYDAVEGFDRYIEGVSDVIYHTDDIQSLRALASQVRERTTTDAIREQVKKVREDQTLSMEAREDKIRAIYAEGPTSLSNFVVNLEEYTNILAGKKAFGDRNMERAIGRQSYDLMKELESRVAANMVAVNPGSWLTNFIPLTQGWSQLSSKELLSGMWDTLRAYKESDGFHESSDFLTNRRGSDPIVKTWQQKWSGTLSQPMEHIDTFVADSLVRARFLHNQAAGMSEDTAMSEADQWTAGVMADRSKGSMPVFFEAKNPVTKIFTQFQLEVNNQLSYLFKDIPREQRDKGLAALAAALLKFFFGAWVYNEIYEVLIGRRPALDPIGILNNTVGDLTGYSLPNTVEALGGLLQGEMPDFRTEKKGLASAGAGLAMNVAEELPFVGGLLGGGRLPINSALPNVGKVWTAGANLLSGEGSAKKQLNTLGKELGKPLTYMALPFGGGQLRKAYQGIRAVLESGKYGIDSEGRKTLQYPVFNDDPVRTTFNLLGAGVFGPTSLKTGRNWIDSDFKSLSAAQTAVYQELIKSGTSERAAFGIITDIKGAEKKYPGTRNEEAKATVQRGLLLDSELSGFEKNVLYYGLLASDKEKELMETLSGSETENSGLAVTLAELKNIEASMSGYEKSNQKRELLMEAALTDDEKRAVYESLISDEDSTITRIQTVRDTEGSFNDFLKISNLFAEIDNSGLRTVGKAIRFIEEMDELGYNESQISQIGNVFLFRTSMANYTALDKFTALTNAGIKGAAASNALMALDALEPLPGKDQVSDIQKIREISGLPFTEREKLAAARVMLPESTYNKVQLAADFGVSVAQYTSFYELLPKYDADGNGSYKHAEVQAALNNMSGLNKDQRAALWQLQTGGKVNPYNTAVGNGIKAVKAAEKEAAKPGTSSGRLSMSQSLGVRSSAGASAGSGMTGAAPSGAGEGGRLSMSQSLGVKK